MKESLHYHRNNLSPPDLKPAQVKSQMVPLNYRDEYGNSQIVKAIVAMAHSLELKLVAEGVETAEQLTFLQELNCHAIQGYFFSQPLSAREFQLYCEAHRPSRYFESAALLATDS